MNCCLTVAGSDSGGNAGVQADLRAFHAYGLHGCTVFAALTAQNPSGVFASMSVPADFVAAQLDAVLGVYSIKGMKTGMLPDAKAVEIAAERLSRHPEIAKVVDPVMVATSGARLSGGAAVDAVKELLLPMAAVVTPNIAEAAVLCGMDPDAALGAGEAGAEDMARRIFGAFGAPVLVKGGHLAGGDAVDILFDGSAVRRYSLPRVPDPVSTHGTGCSLAAALAAELALGRSLHEAVRGAKAYVRDAIANSFPVGPACGVLGFAALPSGAGACAGRGGFGIM